MMATAIELAMQKAQREREARLRSAVAEWSNDDRVHTDPPLPPPPPEAPPAASPAPNYWPLLHADQPPATPETTKENHVAQEFNPQSTDTAPPQHSGEKAHSEEKAHTKPARHTFILPNPKEVGVTEACQMVVRDNPGTERRELISALVKAGYNASSVSSTFGMLVIQKIIRADENNLVWPRYKRYRKLLSHDKWVKEHPEYSTRTARKKAAAAASKATVKKATHESPGRIAAAYANCVRWAREKGRPIPVWDAWLADYRKSHPVTNHEASVAEEAVKLVKPSTKEVVEKARRAATALLQQNSAKPLDSAVRRTDPTGPSVREMTPQQIVDELSLAQARGLLKLLQAAFSA